MQVTESETISEGGPAWSPDGSAIAFAVYDPNSGERIEVIDFDENLNIVRTSMTNGNALATADSCCPAWSHDGMKLAVSGYVRSNDQYDIFLADASVGLIA